MRKLWIVVLTVAGCGSSTPTPNAARGGSATETTVATLAGSRCTPEGCKCRNLDEAADQKEESPPPAGKKRYELRLGPTTDATWVDVQGVGTLVHPAQVGDLKCFYFDLAPGQHTISLRAKAEVKGEGIQAHMRISEHSPKGPWWYDTFQFDCGGDSPCSNEGLRAWREGDGRMAGNVRDHCGSTKIRHVDYSADRHNDEANAGAVSLNLVLDVYPSQPWTAPSDPSCKR